MDTRQVRLCACGPEQSHEPSQTLERCPRPTGDVHDICSRIGRIYMSIIHIIFKCTAALKVLDRPVLSTQRSDRMK